MGKIVLAIQARDFRKDIIDSLRSSFDKRAIESSLDITRKISPLTAIAFNRARNDRRNIFPQLLQLRNELKDLRARIRDSELKILFGVGPSEVKAKQKWHRAIQEIEKEFGQGKGIVRFESTPAFGEAISEAVGHPENPASWVSALGQVAIEPLTRFVKRRAVFELIKLSKALPNSGRLRNSVNSLFGNIEDN